MFFRESDMAPSVTRWMTRAGLHVKREFVTPWGICDLAGLSFNTEHAAHRLHLRQKKSVASITRAALLLAIPDAETDKSISIALLTRRFAATVGKELVSAEVERLIDDGFVLRTSGGRLQKMNGWMPLQDRLVAIELKLGRIAEALQQAKANMGFADESYAAFPMPVARRIAREASSWSSYFDDGIGVIGVLRQRCEVLIAPVFSSRRHDPAIQLYCVEKFWRTHRPR